PQVSLVVPGAGADVMGLRAGDVVMRINDTPVATSPQFSVVLRRLMMGDTLHLVVLRNGKEVQLSGPYQTDFDAAEEFQRLMKIADSPAAQRAIGAMYNGGRGVAKDEAEALKWYRKAAENGNLAAAEFIGHMYENGRGGLTKDEAEAVVWYRKAADHGADS